MHVCKFSMDLKKLKYGNLISMFSNNNHWSMVNVRPSSYGCTWEADKHLKSSSLTPLPCLATSCVHP